MTDKVNCSVIIIAKDHSNIAAVQFKIKLFDFLFTSLSSSLIIFIRTYTVNCRNALDRLHVRMSIILLLLFFAYIAILQGSVEIHLPCVGIYNNHIIANCLQSVTVLEFWLIISEYSDKSKVPRFLWPTV